MLPFIAAQTPSVSLFGAPTSLPGTLPVSAPGSSFALGSASATQSFSAAGAVSSLSDIPSAAASSVSAVGSPAPFADLLSEAVGQVEQYESAAKTAIEGMMTGRGVDVHQAMIATEKAENGFELVLAVRNKALAAYQQVAGMQF